MAEIYRHQQAQEIGSVGSVVLMETFSDALPNIYIDNEMLRPKI